MIAKLTGIMDETGDGWVIVDVGGVGYQVYASSRTLDRLPARGEAVQFYIETVIREDAFLLYGFTDKQEKEWFTLLCSVQGVGAKVGLAILSVGPTSEIQTAIAAQDKATIARASGVGPKLAGRIVNELKDKVAGLTLTAASMGTAASNTAAHAAASGQDEGTQEAVIADAVSALANLGYRPTDAHQAVARALTNYNAANNEGNSSDVTVNTLIPLALKELATL